MIITNKNELIKHRKNIFELIEEIHRKPIVHFVLDI